MALNKAILIRGLYECLWNWNAPSSLKNNRVRGWYGEWLARKYLTKKNFLILHKNWQSRLDARREIDLITRDAECLVFVEVRARRKGSLNSGYYSINRRKKRAILAACRDFLRLELPKYRNYRFDVVEVDLDAADTKVFHHKNVSLFP